MGGVGPPGFHTTAREPKRAHLRVLVFKTPPKFNEKTPEREEKNEILRREREKKSEILGGPAEGGPNQGRSEPGGGGGSVGPNWPSPTKIGLATQNQQGRGLNRTKATAGGQSWSKLVPPDQKRPKSASLRLSPKLGRLVAKVGQAVAKQGRQGLAKVGLAKVGHSQQNQGKTAQTTTQKQ